MRNPEAVRAAKRRYRERNREELRAKNRDYAARKAREAGIPMLGTPESSENRRNARKATGPEHGNWKGDQVGYFALHVWVNRHKTRTGICQDCARRPPLTKNGRPGTEWANVSHEYKRDLNDWVEVCRSCHRQRDMNNERREHLLRIGALPRQLTPETRAKLSAAAMRRWSKSRLV